MITFSEIAEKYLRSMGYEPFVCKDEDEARNLAKTLPKQKKWPCLFVASDTTGEKDFEEFYTENETLDMGRFENLGVIKNELNYNLGKINDFEQRLLEMQERKSWTKQDLVSLFHEMIPNFGHKETGKYLDSKM